MPELASIMKSGLREFLVDALEQHQRMFQAGRRRPSPVNLAAMSPEEINAWVDEQLRLEEGE